MNRLENLDLSKDYDSPEPSSKSWFSSIFPSISFYYTLFTTSYMAGRRANAGPYSGDDWATGSRLIFRGLEDVGVRLHVHGLENIKNTPGPCVFVGNHMSALETFILPGIIQPLKDVTFVVKESLLDYPGLGPVLRSRDPITVSRSNPREDLTKMLGGGTERLSQGRSVVVFPQSTRSLEINEQNFNSIGVKLAKRAGVPVIPVAMRTDAWSMHPLTKDFGPIKPEIPVNFCFGSPMLIEGNGKDQQAAVLNFISGKLTEWGLPQLPAGASADSAVSASS